MNGISSQGRSSSASCTLCGGTRNRGDRCDYCGALYPDMIVSESPAKKIRSLDNKYRVNQQQSSVSISWSWRNPAILFLIPFFIFWNSIAFSFTSLSEALSNPIALFPMPGIHIVIGILGPLYVLVKLINNTTITANEKYLSIKHHPLPWRGNKHFIADEIKQVFVSKGQRSSKKHTWDVPILQLITTSGSRHELLKGQNEVEFADYEGLRRHILKALKITPQQVHGAI